MLSSESSTIWTNWSFWAVVIALLATVLSQLPPLRLLLRRGKLSAEVVRQMFILHKYGAPLAHLHVIVTNNGGRTVRIKGLSLDFKNRDGKVFSLPASTYFQKSDISVGVMFVPFNLKAGEEWGHTVEFWNYFSRHEEIGLRKASAAMQSDLKAKRDAQPDTSIWVVADDANVAPFIELFNKKFVYLPDDYEVTLIAETEPPNSMKPQRFRVVIFDDDTRVLKQITEKYKFGESTSIDLPASGGVILQITQI